MRIAARRLPWIVALRAMVHCYPAACGELYPWDL
jgi:hypothetical protein